MAVESGCTPERYPGPAEMEGSANKALDNGVTCNSQETVPLRQMLNYLLQVPAIYYTLSHFLFASCELF